MEIKKIIRNYLKNEFQYLELDFQTQFADFKYWRKRGVTYCWICYYSKTDRITISTNLYILDFIPEEYIKEVSSYIKNWVAHRDRRINKNTEIYFE